MSFDLGKVHFHYRKSDVFGYGRNYWANVSNKFAIFSILTSVREWSNRLLIVTFNITRKIYNFILYFLIHEKNRHCGCFHNACFLYVTSYLAQEFVTLLCFANSLNNSLFSKVVRSLLQIRSAFAKISAHVLNPYFLA